MKRKCNDLPAQSQIQRSLSFEEEIFSVYKATQSHRLTHSPIQMFGHFPKSYSHKTYTQARDLSGMV